MRVYSQSDEENVRDEALVHDWISSGLLTVEQGPILQDELKLTLRRTNNVLRAVLFLFTTLIVLAAVGLTLAFFDFRMFGGRRAWEFAIFAVWAGISFGLAWLLCTKGQLYRYG